MNRTAPASLYFAFTLLCGARALYAQNLVAGASCFEPPESQSQNLETADLSARLASPRSGEPVQWKGGISALPAILEIRFDCSRKPWYLAASWKWMPAQYAIEIADGDRWRQAAQIDNEYVPGEKIMLHFLGGRETSAVRIVVRKLRSDERRCGLLGLEIYEREELPECVRNFLHRMTPHLFDTPENLAARRSQYKDTKLRQDLLDAEIPAWVPIPQSKYGRQETGRRVNELNGRRGSLLSEALDLYANSGRPAYAKKAWEVLQAIIDHYNRYQAFRFFDMDWQAVTFQEPGYALSSIPASYDVIAETLTPEQKLKALYFLLDVGDFQYRAIRDIIPPPEKVVSHTQIYNWVPNSMGALALTACYLREFPEARVWLREVDAKIPGVFSPVFFLDDGTWWECSPSHHAYALRGVYKYALAKHLLGEPVWDRRFGDVTIADSFEALAKTANPFGEYPSLNDSTGHDNPIRSGYSEFIRAAAMMRRGDMLYAWRAEPTWPLIPGLEKQPVTPEPPQYTSLLMPAAGQAVMRDGWDPKDAWLLFDFGPHGGGHGHLDKLSFALVADEHHWCPDAACSPHYSIFPEQRTWHTQTVSHNTVLVDGQSQQQTTGKLIAWHTDSQADLASAIHWGNATNADAQAKERHPVTHRRTIVHPHGEYFLIHDVLEATDDRSHEAEWLLHIYGEFASQTPGNMLFRHGEKGLLIASPHITTSPVKIDRGLVGGFESGRWRGEGYPGKGDPGWLYIPYFRLPQTLGEDRQRIHFWAALLPFVGKEPPRLRLETIEDARLASGVRLRFGDVTDTFVEADRIAESDETPPATWRVTDFEGDARLVYARQGADSGLRWGKAYNGTAKLGDHKLDLVRTVTVEDR